MVNNNEQKLFIDQLPPEMWFHIFKYLNEQEIQHLIFAYPQFQLLKIVWEAQETKRFETNPCQDKFIPTIHTQYGSRTLFRFSDSDFFYQHIDGCCRVAAVYAFFLLGHGKDSRTYTVRYDRNTHEVCEVKMERLLADAFYNRNCYGSLYRVVQKDENKRQPIVDLDHSVDRTYMTNRHQSQFIGQDLLSRFHFTRKRRCHSSDSETSDDDDDDCDNDDHDDDVFDKLNILGYQRTQALYDNKEKLVDQYLNVNNDLHYQPHWMKCAIDDVIGYCGHLVKQTQQESSTGLFRMLSAKDRVIDEFCDCPMGWYPDLQKVSDLIHFYNHLIFDFDTHQLTVERLPDEKPKCSGSNSLLYDCVRTLQCSVPQENPISYYRINVEKLAKETKGFNHASCHCGYPALEINQFSFLDYTYLSHVHLAVGQNTDHVFVLATYDGIAAL